MFNGTSSPVDVTGMVLDDNNGSAVSAANVGSFIIPMGGTAVWFDADAAENLATAWPSAAGRMVPITEWDDFGLDQYGDRIGLWPDWASYVGDHQSHAAVLYGLVYGDGTADPWPVRNDAGSIYMYDVNDDEWWGGNWDLSSAGSGNAYYSTAVGTNSGLDEASPGLLPGSY